MKKIYFSVLTALVLTACGPKWEPMFNGKDLTGWHRMNGNATYEFVNGELVGTANDSSNNTFLVSDNTYSDFILEFEFLTEGLNSGVQLRSHNNKDNNDRVYGYQFEIDPSPRAWTGGIYDEATPRGWICRLVGNEKSRSAYRDGWNKGRIEAYGNKIRTWVNGIECANLVDDRESEGFFALQVHAVGADMFGHHVKWRNMRIITDNVKKYLTEENPEMPEVCAAANILTEREKAEGWELLWDGKTTKGWKSVNGDEFPQKGWAITGNCLAVHPEGYEENGGDIITCRKFKNFMLKVDFKLTPAANSGIKYFIQSDPESGVGKSIGCEYQVLENAHPDAGMGYNGNRKIASLYDIIPAQRGDWDGCTVDGWHTAMIVVNGPHVEHWLNGVKVVEYERQNQMWNTLVSHSKFNEYAGKFGNFDEGHILLQDHNDRVFYRNIKIKEL